MVAERYLAEVADSKEESTRSSCGGARERFRRVRQVAVYNLFEQRRPQKKSKGGGGQSSWTLKKD